MISCRLEACTTNNRATEIIRGAVGQSRAGWKPAVRLAAFDGQFLADLLGAFQLRFELEGASEVDPRFLLDRAFEVALGDLLMQVGFRLLAHAHRHDLLVDLYR